MGLSLAVYFNFGNLQRVIEIIRSDFPKLPILVGGPSFRWGGMDIVEKYKDVLMVPTLAELEAFIQKASQVID